MAVTATVKVDGITYTATGSAELAGPYYESHEVTIDSCTPTLEDRHRTAVEDAIATAQYEHDREKHDYCHYEDDHDYYEDERTPGPDYWWDPESGEPRCG